MVLCYDISFTYLYNCKVAALSMCVFCKIKLRCLQLHAFPFPGVYRKTFSLHFNVVFNSSFSFPVVGCERTGADFGVYKY